MALKLSMTCGPYDRARALIDGTVKPEGIDLEVYVNPDPGRQTKIDGREFDIAEFYSGLYIADLHYQSLGFTAIPIFVKRMFRHSYIYINKRSGIRQPSDLDGKRVGLRPGSPAPPCGPKACWRTITASTSPRSSGWRPDPPTFPIGRRRPGS